MEWNNIIKTQHNPNTACRSFFNIFDKTYDKYFPKVKIKIKAKLFKTLGLQKAIQSPLRRNENFMNGFKSLIKRTPQNEQKYKNYKNLFKTIKKKAKKIYYSNKLLKCTTTMVIILREFFMFYQIFLSPQVKRSLIISNN